MKIARKVEEDFIVKDNNNKDDAQPKVNRHLEDFLFNQHDGEFWIKVIFEVNKRTITYRYQHFKK